MRIGILDTQILQYIENIYYIYGKKTTTLILQSLIKAAEIQVFWIPQFVEKEFLFINNKKRVKFLHIISSILSPFPIKGCPIRNQKSVRSLLKQFPIGCGEADAFHQALEGGKIKGGKWRHVTECVVITNDKRAVRNITGKLPIHIFDWCTFASKEEHRNRNIKIPR